MDALLAEAQEINSSYGLSETEVERACALSKKYNKPLLRAFEYIEDTKLQLENGTIFEKQVALISAVEHLCFMQDFSVSESIEEAQRLSAIGVKSVSTLTEDFLKIYFSKANELIGFDVETIRSLAKDMKKAKIPAEEFDAVFASADFFGGDLDEAIANYNNSAFWNSLQYSD